MERLTTWALILMAGLGIGMAFPAAATVRPEPTPKPTQSQTQSGEQTQTQTQSQTAAGGQGGQSNSTSDNAVTYNHQDRLQAPALMAPAVYASGPCAQGWSAGASGPGAGLSFGKAKADPSCDRRELARVMAPLNPALALRILCADPIVIALGVTADECRLDPLPPDNRPTVVILEQDKGGYATKEELKRAFESSASK